MNFNDPQSMAAWYRQNPRRNGSQLAALKRQPLQRQFAPAFAAAGDLLRAEKGKA